jgi:hypothetical protein
VVGGMGPKRAMEQSSVAEWVREVARRVPPTFMGSSGGRTI